MQSPGHVDTSFGCGDKMVAPQHHNTPFGCFLVFVLVLTPMNRNTLKNNNNNKKKLSLEEEEDTFLVDAHTCKRFTLSFLRPDKL